MRGCPRLEEEEEEEEGVGVVVAELLPPSQLQPLLNPGYIIFMVVLLGPGGWTSVTE